MLSTLCGPTCSTCPGGPASPAARRFPGALAASVPPCAAAMPAETAAALAAMFWRCEADRNRRGWYRGGAGAAASATQANAVSQRAICMVCGRLRPGLCGGREQAQVLHKPRTEQRCLLKKSSCSCDKQDRGHFGRFGGSFGAAAAAWSKRHTGSSVRQLYTRLDCFQLY